MSEDDLPPVLLLLVTEQCDRTEAGMAALRWGIEIPPVSAEGHDVHACLLDVRDRLDRAEELMREARRVRRNYRGKAALRQRERDDEYDRRLAKYGEGAVRREYEGAREREAKARLDVLELTRKARLAADARDLVDDSYEGLRDALFGMLNVRQELLDRLRELQFESHLER